MKQSAARRKRHPSFVARKPRVKRRTVKRGKRTRILKKGIKKTLGRRRLSVRKRRTVRYKQNFNKAYNEGYKAGFSKGFEDGHQLAYDQQP